MKQGFSNATWGFSLRESQQSLSQAGTQASRRSRARGTGSDDGPAAAPVESVFPGEATEVGEQPVADGHPLAQPLLGLRQGAAPLA